MSRPKARAVRGLFLLALLVGCHTDMGSTISWSPSGLKVAFLAEGVPWVYDLAAGVAARLPPKTAQQIAWSPRENLLAVSSGSVVELFQESAGAWAPERSLKAPVSGPIEAILLSWHPDGDRLLLGQVNDSQSKAGALQTAEILLSSGAIEILPGLGFFGPGGGWTLWISQMALGHDKERTVFSRQDLSGRPLALRAGELELLQDADSLAAIGSPDCVTKADQGRLRLFCFQPSDSLVQVAELPADGLIYPNRGRTAFASLREGSTPPAIDILDAQGNPLASGERFVRAVAEQLASDKDWRWSDLSWSPDGNWLAWVVNGRLCLWNWRNDIARVLPKLTQ